MENKMIDLITVTEAAKILKVSKPQVYLLCSEKRIPYLRLGGANKSIRIDRQELLNWIEAQHEKPTISAN
jgi:excisionase family DNA binding protein